MIANDLLQEFNAFLEGKIDFEIFIEDFPSHLSETVDALDQENKELSDLLNGTVPFICDEYEPDEEERRRWKLRDQENVTMELKKIYQRCIASFPYLK